MTNSGHTYYIINPNNIEIMGTKISAGILDSTLREGEQTPGVVFTPDQRVEIARKLSDVGIRMIEVGHPAVSPDILEGIKRITRLKRDGYITSEIVAHSRAVSSDITLAASLEIDRMAIFYGISDTHLTSKTHKSREDAMSIIGESIAEAKSHGLKVRFTPEDASRTDYNYLIEVIKTARDAGADRIGIADTVGIMNPLRTRDLFLNIRRDVPGIELDIHAHNDMGNAVANSLSAIDGGATIVHSTINGLGERVGITPTQIIAVAMKFHFGIEAAKLDKLGELSRLVEVYSGIRMPPNFPITGKYAFVHKSGVHVSGILGNPATYEFMDPRSLSVTRSYTIDKYTGKHALQSKLTSLGINLTDSEVMAVLSKIKKSPDTRYFDDAKLQEIVGYVSSSRQTTVYQETMKDPINQKESEADGLQQRVPKP